VLHCVLTPWAQSYWQEQDPKHFVLDEVAGYLLVPILFHQGQLWQIALSGYLCFRILDIIKVPPARQIDRKLHGAAGILLDDLVSAGYAVLILYLLWWLGGR
jgi:phosphatidylglycerophosphatase A